jgi:hypothetical protein
MRFVDAYILARTKRKTRRVRMAMVVVVSSLLFSALLGLAFIGQGIIDAGKQVSDVGFNSRHLTTVYPARSGGEDYEATVKAIEEQMNAELRARKVKVTDQTKQDSSYQAELNRRITIKMSEAQDVALKQVEARMASLGDPSGIYHFAPFAFSQAARYQPDNAIDPLVEEIKKEKSGGGQKGEQSFNSYGENLEFYSVEKDMLRTQLAPGQSFDWQPGQPYPLIVSYGYLEKLSGKSLAQLSAAERNKGYRELIKRYAGHELRFCYRNQTAQDQLRAVLQYNTTAETDTDAKTKPLDVPVCGGFDQKQLKTLSIISDADPTGVKPMFPLPVTPAPETTQRTFKLVGFVPANQQFGSTDVITSMFVSISSLPTGPSPGVVPSEVIAGDPLLKSVQQIEGATFSTLFVDFKTRAEQKAFLKHGCNGEDCNNKDALYMAPFGNIVSALEGVFSFLSKVLLVAAGIIMVIAGLMIMLTISKVIADSTKEIAVFRSLGARRRDIAQIYYTYGMMLAGSALLCAVLLAIIGALVATAKFHEKIGQGLVQAVGAYSTDVQVTLLGLNMQWLLGIAGALLAAAAIGITFPVLISVRRKLITILREE